VPAWIEYSLTKYNIWIIKILIKYLIMVLYVIWNYNLSNIRVVAIRLYSVQSFTNWLYSSALCEPVTKIDNHDNGFWSGVLIATLTFSILVEAFNVTHTLTATATGFILGGVSYSIANLILERKSKPKKSKNACFVEFGVYENSYLA
jgi:hypothetical protein